ncbi:ATP-grasp ribosomal peptide maturase [Salinispora arenicola]|uniref:ATP-grasp ribosomal peptide maturase n=1 Tax=Salinispora arenicola TaxID=168697 RepID=UPI00037C88A7|nr:ATP-grasp ribosomal peptide maturase [Salinispora arenicola]
MTVLVLAADVDPTADAVVETLNHRDVPVFRCDTSWFPNRLALDAEMTEAGWRGVLRTERRAVALEGLRSVWYRSPTACAVPDGMSPAERWHATHEAKFGFGGVLWSLPVRWVNHPGRQADMYKPTQLAVAQRCGLTVPATLSTNQADAVRRFADRYPDGIIMKPFGFGSILEEGGRKALNTRLLSDSDLADLRGIETTAHQFQPFIQKAYEVRLTVVGSRMFAAAITAHSAAAKIDFRSDYDALTYQVVDVPCRVSGGVRAFMTQFGLAFGAFDFIVDPTGEWWMLECNASGQYGWIEDKTGLQITSAIADVLAKGL